MRLCYILQGIFGLADLFAAAECAYKFSGRHLDVGDDGTLVLGQVTGALLMDHIARRGCAGLVWIRIGGMRDLFLLFSNPDKARIKTWDLLCDNMGLFACGVQRRTRPNR